MSYYQGDYYQGDFFRSLGKGLKRIGRDIGRGIKAVAPIASIVLPAVGAATLVGRGIAAANKVKKVGQAIRSTAQGAQANAQRGATALVTDLTGTLAGAPAARAASVRAKAVPTEAVVRAPYRQVDAVITASTTTAAGQRKRQTRRAAYRRRRATTTRRRTTRRRYRRGARR